MATTGAASPPTASVVIEDAARRLADGELVAFPTETVYGLGADAEQPEVVGRIYTVKGRPTGHPVIVHLAPGAAVDDWAAVVPPQARALIDAFWPGPLTLIFKRLPGVGEAVCGGQDTIGLRCPSHPVAQALLTAFAAIKAPDRAGVAAPSANRFGHVSPTLASHVHSEFPAEISRGMPVLDGGASDVGIESTILDLSRVHEGGEPVLLRPGHVTSAQIARVLGKVPAAPDAESPRASGTLKAHYAPQTPLELAEPDRLGDIVCGIGVPDNEKWVVLSFVTAPAGIDPRVIWRVLDRHPEAYARMLYATLHDLDRAGFDRIVVHHPPDIPGWRAVNDRIGRAGAAFDLITAHPFSNEST